MNNISVYNSADRPKVQKWLNNVAKFNNSQLQYNRLATQYESVRNMVNKNGPSNTMGKVNSAFSNLNRRFKTKKGGDKKRRTYKSK